MGDLLAKGTMEGASVYAINTTDIVRNASKMHGCSHLGSAVLGYAMTGALLIASTIKENERLTVSFKGGAAQLVMSSRTLMDPPSGGTLKTRTYSFP